MKLSVELICRIKFINFKFYRFTEKAFMKNHRYYAHGGKEKYGIYPGIFVYI